MDQILIATNNFWLGGRETYLATWLEHLGVRASLIATQVDRRVPGIHLFDSIEECNAAGYADRWRAWLGNGSALIERTRPALIWAHHYDLFPAWILSRVHDIPLVVTFHGPLVGAGRPNDLMQALGITLGIHRSEGLSGVSEEVLGTLESLGNRGDAQLLPNTVTLSATGTPPVFPPKRFVLLTRRDKLEHIRQAALLFAHYAREVRGCTLVVADGEMNLPSRTHGSAGLAMRQLGSRWAVRQGTKLLRRIPQMKFVGWTDDPRRSIRESDAVFGMGRVVLEAIAERRPAVLIGYEAVHGLVTVSNFETFRRTNFSGRGLPPQKFDDVVRALLTERPDPAPLDPMISAEEWAPRVRGYLESIGTLRPGSRDLATMLARQLEEGAGADDLFSSAAASLAGFELSTLYRVAEG